MAYDFNICGEEIYNRVLALTASLSITGQEQGANVSAAGIAIWREVCEVIFEHFQSTGHAVGTDTPLVAHSGGGTITFKTNGDVVIDTTSEVKLGSITATDFVVLANKMVNSFNGHTHISSSPGNPTGGPVPQLGISDIGATKVKAL